MIKELPKIGLGTWQITEKSELKSVIEQSVKTGYTHIDTAQVYNNETQIGEILKELKVDREKLFITSKVTPINYKYHFMDSLKESLRRLQVKQLDLMLLHTPITKVDPTLNVKVWKELIQAREDGLIRYAGVSNFSIEELEELKKATGEYPYVNQIVMSPKTRSEELEAFCKEKGIALIGYSIIKPYFNPNPFFPNSGLTDEEKKVIDKIATSHKKDAGQILTRWAMQNGYAVIPKSSKPTRVASNFLLEDFELTNEEMKKISAMNKFTADQYKELTSKWSNSWGSKDEIEDKLKTGLMFESNF